MADLESRVAAAEAARNVEPEEEDFAAAALTMVKVQPGADDHLHHTFHAAALMVHLSDFEGYDMASWARNVVLDETGSPPPEDHRKFVSHLRSEAGHDLTRRLVTSDSLADRAHQALKETIRTLTDVVRIGWQAFKAELSELPVGHAIIAGVEKLAAILRGERQEQALLPKPSPDEGSRPSADIPTPAPQPKSGGGFDPSGL